MTRVLVLRPEPGAGVTVAKARRQGLEGDAAPLFEIEPIAWEAPEPGNFDGLLLTSANAVRHGGDRLNNYRGLQVYAVGEATAEAAREAGFGIASTGKAGIDRLLGSVDADLKLLHLCGEDRRDPEGASQHVQAIAVYRAKAVETPRLPTDAEVILVHSPRAARRLSELVTDRSRAAIVAISDAAAEAVGEGWRAIETAADPTDDAMLALAARLCNKPAL